MIKTENLSYCYTEEDGSEGRLVLNGLNISIDDGSFVAVLGHNGSGKSTFAKQLNAILLPSGGAVHVFGMNTADEERLFDIRSSVGMVFQNPDNQIVTSVVEDEVAFAPENLGVEPSEIRKRVDYALNAVGMGEYKKASPSRLSGGQKQRIAIASALAMEPKCIVLDEATAMLDPKGRQEILSTVRRLNKEKGMTVILITHYMEEAALADRVIVMNEGELVFDGLPQEVFSNVEEIKKIGLDVPQVTELFYLLRKDGFDLPQDVITAEKGADLIFEILGGKDMRND